MSTNSLASIFRRPFSPKKALARKATTISPLQMDAAERSREFGLDYNHAHMRLGDNLFQFDPEIGEWFESMLFIFWVISIQNYSKLIFIA